ncbi:MAG: winged helix-turn-helix transcriptional regulator [Rhodothermales bacterium]|nr:winged helix-turn-helix transcriptional regulator [Rhodothermales bacterium]MCA0269949.1 metalloregulator ArsR/SmtB family transcription factor [Bacteroidota bacterium]
MSHSTALLDVAAVARALANPARLAILDVLAERQACVCGEIVDALPLAQATVSQHLKVLREAGLITGEISGPRTCYGLDRQGLVAAADAFAALFERITPPEGASCACPPGACACPPGSACCS